MTIKEIASLTGKSSRSIQRWINEASDKMAGLSVKMSDSEKSKKPADFTFDETLSILRAGKVSKDLIDILIENMNGKGQSVNQSSLLSQKDIELISTIVSMTVSKIIQSLDTRMNNIESKYNEKQALLPAPGLSDRDNLRKIVSSYAEKKKISHSIAWNKLYQESYYRLNINLKERAKHRNITIIDYAESEGYIPKLLSIAMEIFI